ncbi:hypothetical protein O4160_24370 [Rhodococcus sp. IEGM 1401]|uniref:hypothetical protein n=1 Tax=unclassified Rhodococcus (in: high G+C Gram-positive bacteria) TaxID=192944 RepID=UPI0022B587AE|nr:MULTISPECIES: hypothetical protein [unclassified Rhodococcus (in: high G+C Gram-positive bacteria)]MCZ4563981.1 hypothetical protein [Rhodococcus sp. IEGM 1401]MDI9924139.1 hypothetical protein [Rhodococcus sp. IEGM 1372]MDV8036571.1 hypothetical protein [Rhodococcus sp. IEGM 1414]
MKTFVAGVDRLLAIAAGVGLIAGGSFALAWYYDVPWAREMLSRFDRARIAALPEQGWWVPTLAVVGCIAVVTALLLLIGNFSPRTTGTASVIEKPHFSAHVDLSAIASGVAAELAEFPGVRRARGTAIDDRGMPTITVSVHAAADFDVVAFTARAEARAAFVAESLAGAHVATRIQLHVDKRR